MHFLLCCNLVACCFQRIYESLCIQRTATELREVLDDERGHICVCLSACCLRITGLHALHHRVYIGQKRRTLCIAGVCRDTYGHLRDERIRFALDQIGDELECLLCLGGFCVDCKYLRTIVGSLGSVRSAFHCRIAEAASLKASPAISFTSLGSQEPFRYIAAVPIASSVFCPAGH